MDRKSSSLVGLEIKRNESKSSQPRENSVLTDLQTMGLDKMVHLDSTKGLETIDLEEMLSPPRSPNHSYGRKSGLFNSENSFLSNSEEKPFRIQKYGEEFAALNDPESIGELHGKMETIELQMEY